MEPSSAEDGDAVVAETDDATTDASMEPSSAEDGDSPAHRIRCGFLTLLQWSRPQLRTETVPFSTP